MAAETNALDSPWGVLNLVTGSWRGCPGPVTVSHQSALELQRSQPLYYKAERNPADVMAEELAGIDDTKIDLVARARG